MGKIKLARFTQEERKDIVGWNEEGRSPVMIAIYLNTLYRWHQEKDEVSPSQVERYIGKVKDRESELYQLSLRSPDQIAAYLFGVRRNRRNGQGNRTPALKLYQHFGSTCPLRVD